jgi:ATP-binding cassette, subfamily B, bacterial
MSRPKPTIRQLIRALYSVAKTSLRIAPGMSVLQVTGSAISAGLPIATTYLAALTTTALAEAYAGDRAAGNRVVWLVAAAALSGVLMAAWGIFERYASELMRFRIKTAMSDVMYERFCAIEFWRYDDKDTIDMYERAKEFAQFFPYIFARLADVVTHTFTFVFTVWALIAINAWLGLAVVLAAVPSVIVQFRLSRLNANHWRENVETRRRASWIEWEMLKPQKMIDLRLYGLVRHLLDMRMALLERDQKTRIDFERKFLAKRLGAELFQAVVEVGALVWVVYEIVAHRQPIGQFLFVQQTAGRALGSVSSLVSTVNSMDEDLANLFDYQRFMELPIAKQGGKTVPALHRDIRFKDVSFHYPGSDTLVLDHINLTIKRGQHVALVGENGAGKTTLLKLLAGLYKPVSGEVVVDGVPLKSVDVQTWHRQLGVLSQNFTQYDFATAAENVWFGDVSKTPSQERVNAALREAEAAKFVAKLPKGVDSYVNQWMESDDGVKGVDLSGGQWQRLALARNFYRDSPIIILDEPTSAIDALAEARIFDRLFQQKQKTIITVSHRLSTIEKADMIFMLAHGKVVEHGTHAELVAQHGAYYHMFESQLRRT